MSRRKSKKKIINNEGNLERKIIEIEPMKDEGGRNYIPYCNFGGHRGRIINDEQCMKRTCYHYYRLYISKDGYFPRPKYSLKK